MNMRSSPTAHWEAIKIPSLNRWASSFVAAGRKHTQSNLEGQEGPL